MLNFEVSLIRGFHVSQTLLSVKGCECLSSVGVSECMSECESEGVSKCVSEGEGVGG